MRESGYDNSSRVMSSSAREELMCDGEEENYRYHARTQGLIISRFDFT